VKRNEGTIDRVIRVVLALVAVGAAAVGFCPLYRLVGMSTCPAPRAETPRERTGAAS